MNKAIKSKWVKALRSGKYKQARNALNIDNKFCCLGVLCDLHRAETKKGEWKKCTVDHNRYNYITGKSKRDDLLGRPVMKWARLSKQFGISHKGKDLTDYNDMGTSFADIADIIEKRA